MAGRKNESTTNSFSKTFDTSYLCINIEFFYIDRSLFRPKVRRRGKVMDGNIKFQFFAQLKEKDKQTRNETKTKKVSISVGK